METLIQELLAKKISIMPLPFFYLFLFFLPLAFLLLSLTIKQKCGRKLPPGPRGWPIVGNLPQLGTQVHRSLAQMAETYGPLMSLRLGMQLVVVGSSPEIAAEILKTHDRQLSGRHVPHVSFARDPRWNRDSVAWSFECNEEWKNLRALLKSELFGPKAVDSQIQIRETAAQEMVGFLNTQHGKKVKIREVVYVYTVNAFSKIYFSRKFMEFGDDESKRLSELVREMMELWSAPNLSDLYPVLSGWDVQGLRKKADVCVQKMCLLWENCVRERRSGNRGDGMMVLDKKDFLDVLIDLGFSDQQIDYFFVEMLAAVSDGSTQTVEWAMAELMKNTAAMGRAKDELTAVIGAGRSVSESDLPNLPYLYACIKETLRLHPPAPLLLPHRAVDDVILTNYTIPKNALVYVNAWAIARDPKVWEDPSSFIPERFLETEIDYKGNDFEYLPFGAGRRICAGMPMASRHVRLALAVLIHRFEWSSHGSTHDELGMEEEFGVTLMKKHPLVLIPKIRN